MKLWKNTIKNHCCMKWTKKCNVTLLYHILYFLLLLPNFIAKPSYVIRTLSTLISKEHEYDTKRRHGHIKCISFHIRWNRPERIIWSIIQNSTFLISSKEIRINYLWNSWKSTIAYFPLHTVSMLNEIKSDIRCFL